MRSGKLEEAREAIENCLGKIPNSYSCLSNRVLVEMGAGSNESQEKAATHCLAAMPGDSHCKNWLAMIKLNEGDGNSAAKIYKSLLAENGKNGSPAFDQRYLDWQMAKAEESSGNLKQATGFYQRACQEKNFSACEWLQQRRN